MRLGKSISEDAIIRFLRRKGIRADCCDSCHSEAIDGYSIPEIELSRGRYAEVCCSVAIAWRKFVETAKI